MSLEVILLIVNKFGINAQDVKHALFGRICHVEWFELDD